MTVHQLSRADACRIAVRAQLLCSPRPTDLLDVVRHLTMLQLDPIAAVAPSADLVAWSRLGAAYSRDDLVAALQSGELIELEAMVRPAEDLALYRAEMAEWPGRDPLKPWQELRRDWVQANDRCCRDILARLEAEGPLTSRSLPDTCVVPWSSTGWTNNQNVTKMLDFLVARGEVATAGRRGRERLWDLAARVYPDVPPVPVEEAARLRGRRRLRALGIARVKGPASPSEPADVGDVGEPAVVEGVRGKWRVDASLLGQPFSGRAAVLSPFDRLVHDRKRAMELFDFDYQLEMYKPAAKRRWGYYALPILYGDRLVGKLDATADRDSGVLRVHAVHEDEPFTPEVSSAVTAEVEALAAWLGLSTSGMSIGASHGRFR